jgi:IS605 OrfB family transposase
MSAIMDSPVDSAVSHWRLRAVATEVMQAARPPLWLCAAQAMVAYEWLASGANKLLGPWISARVPAMLQQGMQGNGWYMTFLRDVVMPGSTQSGAVVTWSETAVGVILIDLLYRGGTFYLAVTLDSPEPTTDEADDFLGVDLGIVNLATDSDGEPYSGTDIELKRRASAHRRRNLQRKGTLSARRKLRRLRGQQARYQRNTNHIIAKRVVRKAKGTGRGIALENLGGIRSRITVKRKQRARHANWSFFQLRSFVEYKAKPAGVRVVAVDPRNSSRECVRCGHIDKANRPNQATFSCVLCGHRCAADHNAARVLAARARAAVRQPMVSDAPTGVAPETSPPASAVGS